MISWKKLLLLDWWLIGAIVFLLSISTTMMYGISGERYYKQLIFCGLGLLLFCGVTLIDYHIWQNYAYFFYVFGIIILIAVLLFGETINSTTGWFKFGSISFQPVELAKIFLIIALARYYKDHIFLFNHWKTIFWAALLVVPYIILVLLQPDLGSTLIIVSTFFILLWLTDMSARRFGLISGGILLMIIIIGSLGWKHLEEYQQNRILVFVYPSSAPKQSGYHVAQSIISVGSGQWFGRGLGLGTQSQLRFLPERETDFIFAVIAEELGFFGAGLVLTMFGIIVWRLWRVVHFNGEEYGSYFSAGIAIVIFIHVVVNVGMNMGIMPVTGIPLPFVSSGGSSLLSLLLAIGMVQNYYIQNHVQKIGHFD